jgi:hypothetical protein
VLFDLEARREEAWLIERFPEYTAYRARTPRRVCAVALLSLAPWSSSHWTNANQGRVAVPPKRDSTTIATAGLSRK